MLYDILTVAQKIKVPLYRILFLIKWIMVAVPLLRNRDFSHKSGYFPYTNMMNNLELAISNYYRYSWSKRVYQTRWKVCNRQKESYRPYKVYIYCQSKSITESIWPCLSVHPSVRPYGRRNLRNLLRKNLKIVQKFELDRFDGFRSLELSCQKVFGKSKVIYKTKILWKKNQQNLLWSNTITPMKATYSNLDWASGAILFFTAVRLKT